IPCGLRSGGGMLPVSWPSAWRSGATISGGTVPDWSGRRMMLGSTVGGARPSGNVGYARAASWSSVVTALAPNGNGAPSLLTNGWTGVVAPTSGAGVPGATPSPGPSPSRWRYIGVVSVGVGGAAEGATSAGGAGAGATSGGVAGLTAASVAAATAGSL